MNILQGIILGVVQGLGEFLPISSSGHMLLVRIIMGIQEDSPALNALDVMMHVGTLIPLIIVFWKDWVHMFMHPVKDRTLRLLFVASLPTIVFYIMAKMVFLKAYDGYNVFDSGWFLGPAYLITALLLLITDKAGKKAKKTEVGYTQAVSMGIMQGAIGVIPGISRCGSTISGGIYTGLERETAAKFSFMMSLPAVLGGLLMEGKDALEQGYIKDIELLPTLAGILVAAVVGFIAIRFFLRIVKKSTLLWFALYCALLGVTILALQISGNNQLPPFQLPMPSVG